MGEEDTREAVKVVPEELFSKGYPNSQIQAALRVGYRHIDCAWEYGVHHVHIDHTPAGHLTAVHRMKRPLGTLSNKAVCDGKTSG